MTHFEASLHLSGIHRFVFSIPVALFTLQYIDFVIFSIHLLALKLLFLDREFIVEFLFLFSNYYINKGST